MNIFSSPDSVKWFSVVTLQWNLKQKVLFLALTGLIPLGAFSAGAAPNAPRGLYKVPGVLTPKTISGKIFRGDDVTLAKRTVTLQAFSSGDPTPVASVTTTKGSFSLNLPVGFTGTIKPTGTDITFSPQSITFTAGDPSTNQNFVALYKFFVSKAGNNSNSGREAWPLLDIQAAADAVYPGDSVYIKSGVYDASTLKWGGQAAVPVVKISRDGTAKRPILFEAFGSDIVTLDGRGINFNAIRIEANFITVSKLIVTNALRAGIQVYASWVTTGGRQPVNGPPVFSGQSTGRKVTGGKVVECIVHDNSKMPLSYFGGIQVLGQVDNFTIQGNLIYNNGTGIEFRESHAILTQRDYSILAYRDPWPDAARNCTIKKNIVYENKKHPEHSDGIQSRYPTNMTYENNIAFSNNDDNFDSIAAVDSKWVGNVAFNANPDRTPDGDGNGFKVGTRKGGGNKILNNISFLNSRTGIDDGAGQHNVFQHNTAYKNGWIGIVMESSYGPQDAIQNNLSYLNGSYDASFYLGCNNGFSSFAPGVTDFNYWADGKPPVDACDSNSPYGDTNSFSNTSTKFGLTAVGLPLFQNPVDIISELDLAGLNTVKPGSIEVLADDILSQVRSAFTLQSGSPLIDKGANLGRPFVGIAPDIGAVESH